jgi:predicted dehydrogenase
MKTYRVGIVGFGWVAGGHMMNYNEMPNYEPVAIMSRRKLDPGQIKAQHGVDVKIYNDYDKFLEDKNIDIVDICTPHPFHPEQTIKAANAGKDLIIEKPIGINFKDTVRMLEAVEKNKVKTSVCFEVRFMGVTKAMESIIKEGLIGDIYFAECGM